MLAVCLWFSFRYLRPQAWDSRNEAEYHKAYGVWSLQDTIRRIYMRLLQKREELNRTLLVTPQ
jgi:hypothetical protein